MMIDKLRNHPYSYDSLALIAGALLPLAFAPINLAILAIIAPAILLWTWLNCTVYRAVWRGYLFGLGFFGIGTSWIFISIHVYGHIPAFLASLFTLLFIALLALYPAVQAYVLKQCFKQTNYYTLLLAFPASWVLLEWLRSVLFTGFPWLQLGVSQTNSLFAPYAPLIGHYGLALLLTFSSGLLVAMIHAYQQRQLRLSVTFLLILLALPGTAILLKPISWTTANTDSKQVSLIQGNIPQQLKWSPDFAHDTIAIYQKLTSAHWQSDLIVWPEAAIPMFSYQVHELLKEIDEKGEQHNTTFITGIPVFDESSDSYYNAMIARGVGSGNYYKYHLVPFGEYVPFTGWLKDLVDFFDLPMSDFSQGHKETNLLRADSLNIAPFICYEIAYSRRLKNILPSSNLLVTITNDAWFGESMAPDQHLQIAQMRSLQSGRYQLFASNDGISAIISDRGKIQASLGKNKRAVLTGQIYAMTGLTPWARWGDIPALLTAILLFTIAFLRTINSDHGSK